jgi:hypothetical protein
VRLIIGAGQYGTVELSDEAAAYFKQSACRVELLPMPEVIQAWNEAEGAVIGLLHVTCIPNGNGTHARTDPATWAPAPAPPPPGGVWGHMSGATSAAISSRRNARTTTPAGSASAVAADAPSSRSIRSASQPEGCCERAVLRTRRRRLPGVRRRRARLEQVAGPPSGLSPVARGRQAVRPGGEGTGAVTTSEMKRSPTSARLARTRVVPTSTRVTSPPRPSGRSRRTQAAGRGGPRARCQTTGTVRDGGRSHDLQVPASAAGAPAAMAGWTPVDRPGGVP